MNKQTEQVQKVDKYSSAEYLNKVNAYWRAANYLSVAQLYLHKNPLLLRPLMKEDVKQKIVGHWGTVPGQNFVYAHCNRVINKYDLNMILVSGPGHGGNFFVANSYLEGTYTEIYPDVDESEKGLEKLCKQFSFAGGISSHVAPETPGSINEGGELGYSLAHAFGAVLDNANLIATVVVGDGEAETGPLATSWHGNKFLNPLTDGTVLPILHLNGYKISNPTVLSRIPKTQLKALMEGYGYKPYFVEGDNPEKMHKLMAKTMDNCIEDIQKIKEEAKNGKVSNIVWPMIVLRTPKGWTCPKIIDNNVVEGTFRAHQVPITMSKPEHLSQLEEWLLSYKPYELFTSDYKLIPELKAMAPKGKKRISANPVTNGGLLLKELKTPDWRKYAVKVEKPGTIKTQDMLELGGYVRDLFKLNARQKNFRFFCPDEAYSNRFYKAFETEKRTFNSQIFDFDENLSYNGRIMDSYLSEHMCEGMLEGYLLTGRHGFFASYEAFIRVVDSMIGQHAKWLKVCNELDWRKDIASLNLVLTSNVWQQDHNGYTHQDPGFLDHLNNKKADITRIYLPADANCLLSCFDHCIKSKNYVNAIVASKHPSLQWLTAEQADVHCTKGAGVWDFACFNNSKKPDIVMVGCGDTPNLEALAATKILHQYLPKLNIRFVNVVDLMKLVNNKTHPHGLTDEQFDNLFTTDKPVIFNFHGYAHLIHELVYNRKNQNFHVSGYMEEGTITTPFDMRVQNKVDRYHLVLKALKYIKVNEKVKKQISDEIEQKLIQHKQYAHEYGVDMPEIANWNWNE